jgi:hypothetical protein
MSTITLKLQKTDSDFLEIAAHKVSNVNGNNFYHLPFWYEKVGDGLYVQYGFNELPQLLLNRIKEERDFLPKSEVLPVSVPVKEKVEVEIRYHTFGAGLVVIDTNKAISEDKFPAIKKAIESCLTPTTAALNDTVVEDKTWWQKLGIKFDGKWYTHPKTNTYSYLDQVIQELNSLLEEQPTNDNAFIWTDELINEFLNEDETHYYDWSKEIKSFRQSKQSQPPSELKEGKDWEIVSYLYDGRIFTKEADGTYTNREDGNNFSTFLTKYEVDKTIHSVKRLSDNTEFSKNEVTEQGKIKSFEICGKHMMACIINEDTYININSLTKLSTPTQHKQSAPEPSALPNKEQYVPSPKDFVMMDGIIANVETVFHYKRTVGVVYVSGQKTVRDEWSFDRIEPLKNAPTQQVVEDKPILFTTEDGIEITDPLVNIWHVYPKGDFSIFSISARHSVDSYPAYKKFSTEKAAKQYILENKPCLSINEIISIVGDSMTWYGKQSLLKSVKIKNTTYKS